MRSQFVILAGCFLAAFVRVSRGFPMELQKPMKPEEAVMVEEPAQDDSGNFESDSASEEGLEPVPGGSRESKQLFLPTGPLGFHHPAAALPGLPNRHPALVNSPLDALARPNPYRRLGSSSSPGAELRWFLNRNQLIDGIINALELLRGGFRTNSQSQPAAVVSNSPKRIHLASDSVNKAITIVGTPQADQVMHVASNGGTVDVAAPAASSVSEAQNLENLDLEIQALIDEANRGTSNSINSQTDGLIKAQTINGRPVITNDVSDIYESQVILGHLAPDSPRPAFQGLTSFSNSLPQFQLPNVSQGLQSLGNLLRLPVRVVNGWLVQ